MNTDAPTPSPMESGPPSGLTSGAGASPADPPPPRTGEPGPPPIPEPEAPPLPRHYGQDRAVALVRDPAHLYVYWDLTGKARARITAEKGEPFASQHQTAVRLLNRTEGSAQVVPMPDGTDEYTFDVNSDTLYVAEIGLLSHDGAFAPIAASLPAQTPRDRVSDRVDEEWVVSEEQFERMVWLAGGPPGHSSESISSDRMLQVRERISRQILTGLHSERRGSGGKSGPTETPPR